MSLKILRVGDPHVQVSNLKDSNSLIDYIIKLAIEEDVKVIEFLGDLYHTHAVKRVEIDNFWEESIKKIKQSFKGRIIILVGNHDMVGSKEKSHLNSLNLIKYIDKDVIVVDKPMIIEHAPGIQIGYIPYYFDPETFVKEANQIDSKIIVAHQTFTGASYENGFFAEDGIDPALLKHDQIISGHIHKSQQVGKCFYPGTPKWDTMSDANEPKGLYIFEHGTEGIYFDKKWFSTEHIVTPIVSYEIKEGEEIPNLNPSARNYVVLEGKSAWITKTKNKIKNLAHIKVKPTDRVFKDVTDKNFTIEEYLEKHFEVISGINKQDLKDFIRNI